MVTCLLNFLNTVKSPIIGLIKHLKYTIHLKKEPMLYMLFYSVELITYKYRSVLLSNNGMKRGFLMISCVGVHSNLVIYNKR